MNYLHTFLLITFLSLSGFSQNKPNILWLVSEDNSIHYMDLYSEGGAKIPHIEALAKKGLTFKHAFSQGPVCSVARSTLISGCYAPRIGVQYHRRTQKAPMPQGLKMFPYYLRQEGYYTSNNAKEDYNIITDEGVWDESSKKASYRNRAEDQPFFHVQNYGTTHEGRLHFSQKEMEANPTTKNPDEITPFPYHPNTATSRYTYAKYQDLHQKVDQQIGEFLKQLEVDGLMDNTIIFYYGDHGGVLPRSKGYVYESGLHVPLVIYFPDKWKHLAPAEMGSEVDPFVSFIDFGPTVLNLARATIPKGFDGKAFLGEGVSKEDWEKRDHAFGYADRFDEKYDFVRSYRKGNFKYIRNYQAFNFDGLHNFYRYRMLLYQEWRDLYKAGKLNEAQSQFFQARAPEQLFDLSNDPHEVKDLSQSPQHKMKLLELRGEFDKHMEEMVDLSFFPESHFIQYGIDDPVAFGQANKELIKELKAIADLQLLPFSAAKIKLKKALKARNPWKRYWACIVLSSFGKEAKSFVGKTRKYSQTDVENLVKLRASEFHAMLSPYRNNSAMENILKSAKTETEANLILNTLVLLRDAYGYEFDLSSLKFNAKWLTEGDALVMRRLEYLLEEKEE
ncbi:MAG: sulfatase [Bacteroidota bacterium]